MNCLNAQRLGSYCCARTTPLSCDTRNRIGLDSVDCHCARARCGNPGFSASNCSATGKYQCTNFLCTHSAHKNIGLGSYNIGIMDFCTNFCGSPTLADDFIPCNGRPERHANTAFAKPCGH